RLAIARSPAVLVHHLHELVVHRVRLAVSDLDRGGGAMLEMISHQLAPHCAQRLVDGRDLRHDVRAVAILLHHFVQPAHLPLDSAQPSKISRLDVGVHSHRFSHAWHLRYDRWARLRRRLLVTTLNELKAIAALAITGVSSSPNAG